MADDDARKLFVAGLSDSVTEEVLRELFLSTGATSAEVNVPRDRATGRPRGFAFVTLGSSEEAAKARSALDGTFQGGRSIAVRPFRADGPGGREDRGGGGGGGGGEGGHSHGHSHSNEERTLYVRNLPYECTREEVAELFKSCGVSDIDRVHLPVGPDGRAKGFGFVTLRNAAAAQAALPQLQNASLRGRGIVVNIARAREDRDRDRSMAPPSMREMPPAPPVSRGGDGRRDPRRFEAGARDGAGGEEETGDRSAAKGKKAKKRGGGSNDRDRRRRDEGLRSPRGRAELGDWDDD
jgi:RNA recognition motif-containing protein